MENLVTEALLNLGTGFILGGVMYVILQQVLEDNRRCDDAMMEFNKELLKTVKELKNEVVE